MKAVLVPQPKATLIALGVKTILDAVAPPNGPMRPDGVRGLPGCTLERGERIAIVAGAAPPKVGLRLGKDAEITFSEFVVSEGWRLLDLCNEQAHSLPLGAVVCTVVVADALPIVPFAEDGSGSPDLTINPRGWPYPTLVRWPGDPMAQGTPMDDQLPLGDFTPGRWGWVLSDPRPCDPVPCKGRQGVFALPDEVLV